MLLATAALGGCVTVELPTIAHVHVGHAVTAWADTPGQRALFDVALAEAAVAAEHAVYAVDSARDVADGGPLAVRQASSSQGALDLALPDFTRDLALKVRSRQPTAMSPARPPIE
ncbi:MAG: hypothetical protein IPM15_10195 [Betaproteobacteria bacterium]|nr:hypothetical protein [Betaproteobacteria bacterium]